MPLLSAFAEKTGFSTFNQSFVVKSSELFFALAAEVIPMRNFLRCSVGPVRRFLHAEDGPTAVEYAVLLALILIAVLSAIGAVAQQAGGMWGNVQGQLSSNGFGS